MVSKVSTGRRTDNGYVRQCLLSADRMCSHSGLVPSSDRLLESFTSMGTGKQTGKSKSKAVKSRRAPSVFEAPS
jgi:hypothetical protein